MRSGTVPILKTSERIPVVMNKIKTMALGLLSMATLSFGDVIAVSNLSEANHSPNSAEGTGIELAVSFTTGNLASGYTLTAITYIQGQSAGSGRMGIYESSAGIPSGNPLNGGDMPTSAAWTEQTIDLSGYTTTLDPNTEYFAVFKSLSSSDLISLADTASPNETQGDSGVVGTGWNIGDKTLSRPLDGTWQDLGNYPLKIGVTVIPEPAVAGLIALFGSGFIFIHRLFRS